MYAVKLTRLDETKMRIFDEADAKMAWSVFNKVWARCQYQPWPYRLELWENETLIQRVQHN